ncbi:MAG: hypothetical protein FJ096_11065 [Deltaproteobacteria bacterium]|nr:hypothetical protein [Deltaproteobacteria bacterium]
MCTQWNLLGMIVVGLALTAACTVKKQPSTWGTGGGPASSSSSAQASSASGSASSSSGGGFAVFCNPVTSEGCTPEKTCDATTDDTFECLATGEMASGVCGLCDNAKGPYCGPGSACLVSGKCARFCCDDGDCGTGKCIQVDDDGVPLYAGVDVGLCIDASAQAACDVPLVAPSRGECVTLTTP